MRNKITICRPPTTGSVKVIYLKKYIGRSRYSMGTRYAYAFVLITLMYERVSHSNRFFPPAAIFSKHLTFIHYVFFFFFFSYSFLLFRYFLPVSIRFILRAYRLLVIHFYVRDEKKKKIYIIHYIILLHFFLYTSNVG